MKKFKELTEQHREEGRFKPVKPHNVSSVAAASPRSSSDSASAKLKEEKKDKYDEGEYDQEGDMAKSDLRSIMANAKKLHDMIEDADNLPEWCQNKITLAEDYISTVANYMTAEMNEEVQLGEEQHKEIDVHTEVEDGSHQDKNDTKDLHDRVKAAAKKHGATITYQDRPSLRGSHTISARGSNDFHKEVKHIASDYEHLGVQHEINESAVPAKEKTVMVRHKTSGKELVVSPEKAKQLKPQGYHPVKEEVEQIDELKKSTLGSYVKKASDDAAKSASGATSFAFRSTAAKNPRVKVAAAKYSNEDEARKQKRLAGIGKAATRLSKEEVEQIDEKNEPTNPALWSRAKALARSKFDVYPSAYANGWASKWYKSKGGSWKSVSEAKEEPPFDKPYTTVKKVVTDKSGAKHSPMSRARDIARMAMKKQMEKMKPVKESLEESRKAEIVKEIMKKKKANSEDAFQKDPELTATLTKGI